MAYVENFNEDDELKKDDQGAVTTSSETTLQSTPAAGGSSAPAAPAKPTGSGFTNLVSYVKANKPQAAEMGNKVTGGLQDQVNKNTTDATSYTSGVTSAAQESANKATGAAGQVTAGLNSNPASFAQDSWKQLFSDATAGYGGPTSAANTDTARDIGGRVQKTDQGVKALSTFEGRGQAVGDAYKDNQNYQRGEKNLDSFLLGTGGGSEKLGAFQQSYAAQDPSKGWQGLLSGAETAIGDSRTAAEGAKTTAQGQVGSKLAGYGDKFRGAGSALATESGTKATQLSGIKEAISRGDYSGIPGLDAGTAKYLLDKGYSLEQLVSGTADRGLGDVVGQDDIAGYDALRGLTGDASEFDFAKTGGTTNPFAVNSGAVSSAAQASGIESRLAKALADKQAERDSQYTAAQEALKTGKGGAALGISDADLQALFSGYSGDLSRVLSPTKGAALNLGDVATDADRTELSSLLSGLGLSGTDLTDTQDEGAAYGGLDALQDLIQSSKNSPILGGAFQELTPEEQASGTPAQFSQFEGLGEFDAADNSYVGSAPIRNAALKQDKTSEPIPSKVVAPSPGRGLPAITKSTPSKPYKKPARER